MSTDVEGLLRQLAPQVLGAVLRGGADFGAAEDAVQEALIAAARQWPVEGVPDSPRGWLIRVASRRLIDWQRREAARRGKEAAAVGWVPSDELTAPAADSVVAETDDGLRLLFLCCHRSLPRTAQVALTLRAVGGLSTREIARAFLVPEDTMARRITRAKRRLVEFGMTFGALGELTTVLEVLYLIFNEGYTASAGTTLHRADLTGEAIRLTRLLHSQAPGEGEVAGLLALMLLTDARSAARLNGGDLVPLAEQDRSLWDRDRIAEGTALISSTLAAHPVGPYQVQAAIAALHDEAARASDTDWLQIAALYRVLNRIAPSPVVTLNRAVALGETDGPLAGLAVLDTLEDPRLADHHRVAAVRAHLLERAGDLVAAKRFYERAAAATASAPERAYLLGRAARLG
ncbi:RNA polymerase sigma-70 factor, ECF subfamily [Alloactinosynnema sp. L-07]|uniref:RNA polymerase sigma factor n=1 Tax=Alloactinosynnema sp. L-07 TaxID=1653480 RepID=UPI00065EF4E6|nr:sigma-70 family RNA polymerase sigma factor [Alloactinosynnema sp. L-07]CRK59128.1 RNA polymerase sigma-70 factor, ECF subfamily [Alloactinosynnema sp. L-07]